MASPVAAVDCQLYYGQRFDGVPWLKNCRLHARFNLLILTHMPVINVLKCPGTVVSPWSFISGLMSWNGLCMCWILEDSFLWCFLNCRGNFRACWEKSFNPVNIMRKALQVFETVDGVLDLTVSSGCFTFCKIGKLSIWNDPSSSRHYKQLAFFLLPIFLLWISPSHIFPSRPSLFVLKKRPHGTV